jgi:hypothetical protein
MDTIIELGKAINATSNFTSEKRRKLILTSTLHILNICYLDLLDALPATVALTITDERILNIVGITNERYYWDTLRFLYSVTDTKIPDHFKERANLVNRRYHHAYLVRRANRTST